MTEKGVNADAISYLVGYDRGLRGIYTDVRALDLQAAIGRFPNVLNPPPESQIVDGGFSSSCGQIAGIHSPQKPTLPNILDA